MHPAVMAVTGPESLGALLRAHIDEVADTLDGGVFAPHQVQRLDVDLVGRIFAELASDRSASLAHWPADEPAERAATCPFDEEQVPCARFQALMSRYGVLAHRPATDGQYLASADWRAHTDEEVLRIIDLIVSEIT